MKNKIALEKLEGFLSNLVESMAGITAIGAIGGLLAFLVANAVLNVEWTTQVKDQRHSGIPVILRYVEAGKIDYLEKIQHVNVRTLQGFENDNRLSQSKNAPAQ